MSVYDTDEWQHWLASIREQPEDDTRRLIAADFLEERGEAERAELIRVQCHPLYREPCGQVKYPLNGLPGQESLWDMGVYCLDYANGRDDQQDQWCPQCKLRHRVMQITEAWDDADTRHVSHPFTGNGWTGFVVKTYDRGMLHTVRAPLAALVGGECGRCEGLLQSVERTGLPRHLYANDCHTCHGTGRTVGVLPALVRREPVCGGVEVVDREPLTNDDSPVCGWFRGPHSTHPQSDLPAAVFDLLEGGRLTLGGACREYDTTDAARAALSTATLQWAASQTPSEVSV